ncbi:hypothetical protein K1719_044959 [Acacia pycnantha]|nr:hypothetical protein K1719_044959 [Acacia pycnantha]
MPELANRECNKAIDSRVEIKNHIMEALRNPRFKMIGLCGLGGVGKTTIAKDIEKEEKNQKVFAKKTWRVLVLESLLLRLKEWPDENILQGPNDIVFGQLHTLKMENLPALTGDFSIKDRATKNASNKIFKSLFNKVLLPKLEILELSNLNSLISLIWDDQLLHNSFNNLKTRRIKFQNLFFVTFGFPSLTSLELYGLPNLRNFYPQKHTLEWPHLNELSIQCCDELEIFEKEVSSSSEIYEEENMLHSKYPLLPHDKRYVTSRKLVLDEDDAIMIRNDQFPADCFSEMEILQIEGFVEKWVTFPYTLLERFPNLNELYIENSSFEEIFPSIAPSCTSFHNLTVPDAQTCPYHFSAIIRC